MEHIRNFYHHLSQIFIVETLRFFSKYLGEVSKNEVLVELLLHVRENTHIASFDQLISTDA